MAEKRKNSIILIGNTVFPFTDTSAKTPSTANNTNGSNYNKKGGTNFAQLNYYTENNSNLTVFLDDSDIQDSDNNHQDNNSSDNFPFFFNPQITVDFPFISPQTQQNSLAPEVHQDLCRKSESNKSSPAIEGPEFIDVNSLVLPSNYFPSSNATQNTTVSAQFISINNNAFEDPLAKPHPVDQESDDDVVFVKEYRQEGPNEPNSSASLTIGRVEKVQEAKKMVAAPRRNPKRQVQMQKVSYDLATKLSWEGCYESTKFGTKEVEEPQTTRKLTKVTRTSSPASSSNVLKSSDFREWPVEGMHEKPTFNPVTKKIEKLPNPNPTAKKPRPVVQRTSKAAIKRQKKGLSKKATKTYETNREFATMAHHNLHYTMSFVNSLKQYNEIMSHLGQGDENKMAENLQSAGDILENACVLYCVANDVPELSLAKYLVGVNLQEDVAEFVDCVVDGCKTKVVES